MTSSSLPLADSREYLGVSDDTLDLLLDWGPIAYVLTIPFLPALLKLRGGLRLSVQLAAWLAVLAALIRCVPALLSDQERTSRHTPMVLPPFPPS